MPTSRSAAAPARIAPSATPGPPQLDGWRRATDELGDVSGGNDHGVDPAPLELDDLVARHVLRLRDRELPDRDVAEQLERLLEVWDGEVERLGVVQLEHALELLLARNAHDHVEPDAGRRLRGLAQAQALVVLVVGRDDEDRVGAGGVRLAERASAAPEDRQLGRVAHTAVDAAEDERLRTVRLCGTRSVR